MLSPAAAGTRTDRPKIPLGKSMLPEEVEFAKQYGRDLRILRRTLRLSRAKLGALVEVHRNTVYRWEQGVGLPNLYQHQRLSAAFEQLGREWVAARELLGKPA